MSVLNRLDLPLGPHRQVLIEPQPLQLQVKIQGKYLGYGGASSCPNDSPAFGSICGYPEHKPASVGIAIFYPLSLRLNGLDKPSSELLHHLRPHPIVRTPNLGVPVGFRIDVD